MLDEETCLFDETVQFVRNCEHCSAASYGCGIFQSIPWCCWLSYTSICPQVHTCSLWNTSCASNSNMCSETHRGTKCATSKATTSVIHQTLRNTSAGEEGSTLHRTFAKKCDRMIGQSPKRNVWRDLAALCKRWLSRAMHSVMTSKWRMTCCLN